MSRRASWLVVVALVLLATAGCKRGSDHQEGERLVRAYLEKTIEAYRASDQGIVDPLVGEEHALRLLGLIGVKRDAGLTLDAQLLELRVERVARQGPDLVVETRERWHYRDRKIGTGEQFGDESTDAYHLRYRFSRNEARWILQGTEFLDPPNVGRKTAVVPVDAKILHGLVIDRTKEGAPEEARAPDRAGDAPTGRPAP